MTHNCHSNTHFHFRSYANHACHSRNHCLPDNQIASLINQDRVNAWIKANPLLSDSEKNLCGFIRALIASISSGYSNLNTTNY